MPGSRLEIFEGAGHMPHDDDPARFAEVLDRLLRDHGAARLTTDHWQPLLGE